jgi:hypothetical protein
MRYFARWLAQQGLPVERVYGVHGTGFATEKHVRQVLEMREE